MSLSRSTGKFKLVENGKVTAEKFSDEIVQYMKKISIKVHVTQGEYYPCMLLHFSLFFSYHIVLQAEIFTLGCFYRDEGVKFMSMYGSVTDAQVFSRELSHKEMADITSCRHELHGHSLYSKTL